MQASGPDSPSVEASGAGLLARTLKSSGVDRVFGLCGDHVNVLYHALDQVGIDIVSVRQESAAVHMADGWARATGTPGVAVVTGAPGHTTAITGLAVANDAGSPVMLISGATPIEQREFGGLQALDQGEIARPVTKFMHEVVSPDHYGQICARSLQMMMSGTPGPVSLGAPVDSLTGPVRAGRAQRTVPYSTTLARSAAGAVDQGAVEDAARLLSRARRPVLILGSGAFYEYSQREATELVRDAGFPVFTVDLARGLVPDDGEVCFGYADPLLSRTFRDIREADLVLLIGTQANFHLCLGQTHLLGENTKIIQAHRDAHKIGMNRGNAAAFVGPVKPVLDALLRHDAGAGSADRGEWMEHFRRAYREQPGFWEDLLRKAEAGQSPDSPFVHPARVCMSLERHRTDRTVITLDAGDFIHWPRCFFPARSRGRWMDGATYGALGIALPLGIGAQFAFPDDPVWAFLGDGGFGFYSWELTTAVEQRLPIKVIVGNDSAWGIEKRLQLRDYGRTIGCELPDIRYDRFAEVAGAKGFHVEHPAELDPTIDAFITHDGPALLNVRIPPDTGRPLAFGP